MSMFSRVQTNSRFIPLRDESIPGPGAYHNEVVESHFERIKQDKRPSAVFRSKSPRMVRPESITAGPGAYEPQYPASPVQKGPSILRSKSPRFQKTETDSPGPGAYNVKEAQYIRRGPVRSITPDASSPVPHERRTPSAGRTTARPRSVGRTTARSTSTGRTRTAVTPERTRGRGLVKGLAVTSAGDITPDYSSPSASRDSTESLRRLQGMSLTPSQRHGVVPHTLTSPRMLSHEVKSMQKRTDDRDLGRNTEPIVGRMLRSSDAEMERLLAAARAHTIRGPATGRAHKKPSAFDLKLGTVVPPLSLQILPEEEES